MENMNKGKSINLKLISVEVSKEAQVDLKLFQLDINVMLVDGHNIFSARKNLSINDFIKFFFSKEDCAYFNEFIPYNKMQILSRLHSDIKISTTEGLYTKALLSECIYNIIDDKKQRISNDYGILSANVMFIYYMCKPIPT